MSEFLEQIRNATVGDKVEGSLGTVVALGIVAILILAIVGWGYTWKFAFGSVDNGDQRCVSLSKTQKNLIKLYLVVTLILGVLSVGGMLMAKRSQYLY